MAGNVKASFRPREATYSSRKKIRATGKAGLVKTRSSLNKRRQRRQLPSHYTISD